MKRELEVASCNIIKVGVETNTPKGGDAGQGGRTTLTLQDMGGTDISCFWDVNTKKLEISLGGDSEYHTFRDCLKFAYLELSRQNIKNDYERLIKFLFSPQSKVNEDFRKEQERRLELLRVEFNEVVRDLQEFEAYHKQNSLWSINWPDVG
jgi:hypothetical protein